MTSPPRWRPPRWTAQRRSLSRTPAGAPAAIPAAAQANRSFPEPATSPSAVWRDPSLHTSIIEVLRRPLEFALRAAVGVEDQPRSGPTGVDGHAQGVADELGPHVVGHGPAHHPAGGQ